ncbi:hypothetical protein [Roseovarius sp. E0-M6]|uniref:hypothetical protein n=1 Tax=Roseovarius sp. E0-M6 TaxID=3127118 RepID=UPI00300F8711
MKIWIISTATILAAGSAMASEGGIPWDTDGNGTISAEEYMAGEKRDMVYNTWDAKSDGTLSREEFAAGKWKMFDENQDNAWDTNETLTWMDAAERSGTSFPDPWNIRRDR